MLPASLMLQRDIGRRFQRPRPLPEGLALFLCFTLSLAAILVRSTTALFWLSLANVVLVCIYRFHGRMLLRFARLFLWQGAVVTGLHLLRYGFDAGQYFMVLN